MSAYILGYKWLAEATAAAAQMLLMLTQCNTMNESAFPRVLNNSNDLIQFECAHTVLVLDHERKIS